MLLLTAPRAAGRGTRPHPAGTGAGAIEGKGPDRSGFLRASRFATAAVRGRADHQPWRAAPDISPDARHIVWIAALAG
jgi:hypothetical protein